MAEIRTGRISSINLAEGKARIVFEDRDASVSSEIPFLSPLYDYPKVGDFVKVACPSDNVASGIILGTAFKSTEITLKNLDERLKALGG